MVISFAVVMSAANHKDLSKSREAHFVINSADVHSSDAHGITGKKQICDGYEDLKLRMLKNEENPEPIVTYVSTPQAAAGNSADPMSTPTRNDDRLKPSHVNRKSCSSSNQYSAKTTSSSLTTVNTNMDFESLMPHSSHQFPGSMLTSTPTMEDRTEGRILPNSVRQFPGGMLTSTPTMEDRTEGRILPNSAAIPQLPSPLSRQGSSSTLDTEGADDVASSIMSSTQTEQDLYDEIKVPILGYEVMEERPKFTVFKICVQKNRNEKSYLFRRYTDFVRANDKLRQLFPHFRLALPPKRWFGDNYENEFLEERLLGLQAFLNNIVGHRDVCNSEPVREFLCLDEPPGPHDSLEESRAKIEAQEAELYCLRQELRDRDTQMALLSEEVRLCRDEVENLRNALRVERSAPAERRRSTATSDCSLTEADNDQNSAAEADQNGLHGNGGKSSTKTSPAEGSLKTGMTLLPANYKSDLLPPPRVGTLPHCAPLDITPITEPYPSDHLDDDYTPLVDDTTPLVDGSSPEVDDPTPVMEDPSTLAESNTSVSCDNLKCGPTEIVHEVDTANNNLFLDRKSKSVVNLNSPVRTKTKPVADKVLASAF